MDFEDQSHSYVDYDDFKNLIQIIITSMQKKAVLLMV